MSLCVHRNAFGEPRKGAHSARIPYLDVAAVDTALTVVLAVLSHVALGRFRGTSSTTASVLLYLLFWLVLGTALHIAFCVDTRVVAALRSLTTHKS